MYGNANITYKINVPIDVSDIPNHRAFIDYLECLCKIAQDEEARRDAEIKENQAKRRASRKKSGTINQAELETLSKLKIGASAVSAVSGE